MPFYHIIDFPLQRTNPSVTIPYLPFGTRTLKLRFTNPNGETGNYVLRSEHVTRKWGKSDFFSHEDNGDDFVLSWGGGHEEGSCVSGQDMKKNIVGKKIKIPFEECGALIGKAESWVYVNLHHQKGAALETRNMLLSVREKGNPNSEALFTLPLILVPPPDAKDPVRLMNTGENAYAFQGKDIPDYLGRWWSPADVTYKNKTDESVPACPDITISTADEGLKIKAKTDEGETTLVEYVDRVQFQDLGEGHTIDADLFHFTHHYYVIRLWFYWLWKQGTKTWGHEIPDVERFDFVLDTETNKIVYVATDTHWRESWAPGPEKDEPVRAQIGLLSPEILKSKTTKDVDEVDNYIEWMLATHEHEDGDEPHIPYQVVMRELRPGPFFGELGLGGEAHVPYFVNCPPPKSEKYVASDPRNG
jgi:hypothetical protein